MGDENNKMDGEKNVFEISSNPAPIIKLTDINLAGDDVYLPNDVLRREYLTSIELQSRWITCIPVEVMDPDNFWVQMERTQSQFQEMMNNLQYFYRNYGGMLASLARNLSEGLNVVVLRNNCYFRCRILRLTPTHVQVYYVDYGKTTYAPNKNIFHLHREFGVLKSQAIHCKLFNIKAPTHHMLYSKSARIATSQMLHNQMSVGYVDAQTRTGILEVSLFKVNLTSGSVNDWLVHRGHATLINTQSSKS